MRIEGKLVNGEAVRVTVEGERIATVTGIAERAGLPWLLPPLVDLQHNGSTGVCFHQLGETGPEPLTRIARHLRRHGVGRCLLTIPSATMAMALGAYRTIDRALIADRSLAALFFGCFQEGIFISPEDGWRGAHPRDCVLPPDYTLLRQLDEASGGRIRMVNVAPEQPGGLDFVSAAAADGKQVAMGHACPDTATIDEAIARGATWVTHFGNGAAPQVARFKNPFWTWLARPQLKLGLICDGFHLPPELVDVAFRCKGIDGCIPVSDASGFAGQPPGRYQYGQHPAFVIREDGLVHLQETDKILMGAWFQLDRGVEFLVQRLGWELPAAWRQCSEVPAAAIGIELPAIRPGAEASFVAAHWDDGLVLDQCVHLGEAYLDAPIRPTTV